MGKAKKAMQEMNWWRDMSYKNQARINELERELLMTNETLRREQSSKRILADKLHRLTGESDGCHGGTRWWSGPPENVEAK